MDEGLASESLSGDLPSNEQGLDHLSFRSALYPAGVIQAWDGFSCLEVQSLELRKGTIYKAMTYGNANQILVTKASASIGREREGGSRHLKLDAPQASHSTILNEYLLCAKGGASYVLSHTTFLYMNVSTTIFFF